MIQKIYDFLSGAVPGGIFLFIFILSTLNLLLYHLYRFAKLISRESYHKKIIQYNIILWVLYLILWFMLKPEPLPESVIILPFQKGNNADLILCEAVELQLRDRLNRNYFLHPWDYLYQTALKDSFSSPDYRMQLAEKMEIKIVVTGDIQEDDNFITVNLKISSGEETIKKIIEVESYHDAVVKIFNQLKIDTDILKNNTYVDERNFDEKQLTLYAQAKFLYLNNQFAKIDKHICYKNMLFDILSANILLKEGIQQITEATRENEKKLISGTTVIADVINPPFQKVKKILYPYVKEGQDNAEINKILGRLCLYEKNYESAEVFLKKAWLQNRCDARIYYDLAFLNGTRLKELGFKNRIEVLERSVYFDPGFKDAVYELADEYFSTGTAIPSSPNTVKALKFLNNYLRLNSYEVDILSLLASIYVQIKETRQAIDLYKKVLELKPDHPEIHYNLGICYFHLQEYELAEQYFLEAIRINDHTDSYLYLGGIYKLKNDFNKALYYFRERVKRKTGDDDEYARQAMRGIRIVLDNLAKKESLQDKNTTIPE
jgi:tetratricopeptide (TPR) repeat protein